MTEIIDFEPFRLARAMSDKFTEKLINNEGLRILVCGGRKFNDYELVRDTLNKLTMNWNAWLPRPGTVIIHGGASGADSLADQWAVVNWIPIEEYKADWGKHGRAAGPIRNQQMIDEGKPDLVVAFPGGKGTADMICRAKKAGIKVIEIKGPEK